MIWNDVSIKEKICLSKFIYLLISCPALLVIFGASKSLILHSNLQNIIMATITILAFAYFGGCNIFIIFKGNKLVKTIKEEEDYFLLTNAFNKQIRFNRLDIDWVQATKFSIFDRFFTDFPKQIPGLDLFLKNGRQYRISSDMENIDSLREQLLKDKAI